MIRALATLLVQEMYRPRPIATVLAPPIPGTGPADLPDLLNQAARHPVRYVIAADLVPVLRADLRVVAPELERDAL